MPPVRMFLVPVAVTLLLAANPAQPFEADTDSAAVEAVVRGFHAALEAGDAQTAAGFLAPDAVVLEGGDLETRQAYVDHHLPADISFAQAASTKPGRLDVKVNGDTAWVNSTTTTQGTYKQKPLNLAGAETMILSRTPSGWLIRTIHWSASRVD